MKRYPTFSLVGFTLALALPFFLFACGGGGGGENPTGAGGGKELVIAFETSPTNLDSRVGNDQASGRVFDLIYSGLIKVTPDSNYAPDLAESWETPDNKTIVFHLRPNLKFQNGQPLTAKDVKWTYDSLMAENFVTSKKSGYATVDHIEAPDARTVIFKLKEPNGGIFDNLTLGVLPIGADTNVYKTHPIGAGPYQVVDFRPDDRVVLKAWDQWHGGAPKIKNVVIRIIPDATTRILELRKGTVNFALNSVPYDAVARFQNDKDFTVVKEPGAVYQYLAFNLRDPILKHVEVRRAIAHAVNREQIVRDLLLGFGTVTDSIFPKGHWARAENLKTYPYDQAKAKQLLDQAGYRDPDGDGPQTRFKLVYKTSTDAEANQQAQMIQQMLKQVGIDVEIQSNEFGVFYEDIQKGNFQMYSLRRAGVSDPDFLYVIFHSSNLPPEGQNRGYYVNKEVDRLIEEGRSTFDRSQRKVAYVKVQQILQEDLPYLSLYHRYNVAIMRSDIHGYVMYPSGFLLSVPYMSID
ncbi:MAG: ABC transporter substrate-binding protein [Thermoanaerobaculia bacterium]